MDPTDEDFRNAPSAEEREFHAVALVRLMEERTIAIGAIKTAAEEPEKCINESETSSLEIVLIPTTPKPSSASDDSSEE
ncbi:hypothetical protein GcM1_202033 [Golovinomyces cichoracearum]|uniref:Uncharacterized protein n=1 Tax=Golovinomyces cichoracearum TaxID=62708 RepID=A0A420IY33_9PEZI|nr:hypothetical protein GcM1_202033 [Golovinomyces cichoracearum]